MKICCDENLSFGWIASKVRSTKLTATLIVKGTFRIQPGKPATWWDEPELIAGDKFQDDDPTLALKYPSDFAPFKPRGEAILWAVAHAPAGQPATIVPVRFRAGKVDKTLQIVGDRTWKQSMLSGPTISAPQAFKTMPIDYTRAFGGPGSVKNPLGRGLGGEAAPNIELPNKPAKGPKDDVDPAGFAPLSPSWKQRAGKTGTYDEKWKKERWPWFPDDFDYAYFNAAPPDQQIEGYFRGDEALEFHNLHPKESILKAQLPQLKARCFLEAVNEKGALEFKEAPLKLDTIWIDLAESKMILVWRGLAEVRHIKLEGVENFLVLTEPLSELPPPADKYRAVLYERLNADKAEDAAEDAQEEAELKAMALVDAQDEAASAAMDASFEATMAQAQGQLAAHEAEVVAMGMELASPAQLDLPAPSLDESLAQLGSTLDDMRAGGADVPPLDFDAAEFNALSAEAEAEGDDDTWTREKVENALKEKMDLTEQDFSELDLSGVDFSGTNLTGCTFTEANLEGALFVAAVIVQGDFGKAKLNKANFTDASLAMADFDGAELKDAKFQNTNFDNATLSELNMAGLKFEGCSGRGTDFSGSNLEGADFSGTSFPKSAFTECKLAKAKFVQAQLQAAQIDAADAREADFTGADISGWHADVKANFTGAKFVGVKGQGSIWEESILDKADFTRAVLTRSIFTSASLRETIMDRAHLANAVFDDAKLHKARMTNANMLRAALERADLTEATFEGSNLYEAGLWEAILEKTDFKKANLKGTLKAGWIS